MPRKSLRYLRWWVADNKSLPSVYAGPLLVIAVPIAVVGSALQGDKSLLAASTASFLLGIVIVFGDLFKYRGREKPWRD